jgi:molecular chaperone GrpE
VTTDGPKREPKAVPIDTGEQPSQQERLSDTAADLAAAALELRIAQLESERDDLRSTLVRRQADFDNYRKRVERDRHEESRRGVERLIEHLLPVLDAFERALASHKDPAYEEYRRGIELVQRQLWDVLARHGLERIHAEGKHFDPHFHQAVERVESDEHSDGSIVEVLQPGYLFHGRVLRPAAVRVAVNPGQESKKHAH